MYSHDTDEASNQTSRILDDVHHVLVTDLLLVLFILVFAGVSNTCLLAFEYRHWKKTSRDCIPRLLVVLLAVIDIVGVLGGLLPRFLVLRVMPCHRTLFLSVHMMTISVQLFAIVMSQFTVVLMSVERFTSILMPFFYIRSCTARRFIIIESVFAVYSAIFVSIASFFNFCQYDDTYLYYGDVHQDNCQENLLTFEFGSANHQIDFPWRYSELGGVFQFHQLVQDFLLTLIVVVCNCAVVRSLNLMDKRLPQVAAQPNAVEDASRNNNSGTQLEKDFSRLMTAITVVVILLTSPQMVRNLCNYLHVAPSYLADFLCVRLALCTACANPLLYGLFSHNARRKLTMLLMRICSICWPSIDTPGHQQTSDGGSTSQALG